MPSGIRANRSFRVIKPEIRVLGVDDGAFVPHSGGSVSIIGVVYRGSFWFDGLMHTEVTVDGFDATDRIAEMILTSPHYKQLRVAILNGVTFAGFNVVNIKTLHRRIKLPLIALTQKKPNLIEIRKALENLPKSEQRWRDILDAGSEYVIPARNGKSKLYVHLAGLSEQNAVRIIQIASSRSNIPEPLRVAHLIASGISK